MRRDEARFKLVVSRACIGKGVGAYPAIKPTGRSHDLELVSKLRNIGLSEFVC